MSYDQNQYDGQNDADVAAARVLGWVSIAIGLTEIAMPGKVQALLGLEDSADRRGVIYTLGVREVLHGVSILAEKDATPQLTASLWGRVAGDALDSALLGVAATQTKAPMRFAAIAATVMAIGAADMYYAQKLSRRGSGGKGSRRRGRRRAERMPEIEYTPSEPMELAHG